MGYSLWIAASVAVVEELIERFQLVPLSDLLADLPLADVLPM